MCVDWLCQASLNTQFDGAAQVARELAGIRQLEQMRSLAARSETLRIVRKVSVAAINPFSCGHVHQQVFIQYFWLH